MKSPITNKEMKLVSEKKKLKFRKEEFEVILQSYYCEDSGEKFTDSTLDHVNFEQVYNQYREKNHIPFAEEIIETREKYGLSAKKMSQLLGFGDNQYSLYENGEIPSSSNGTTIKVAKQPSVFFNIIKEKKELLTENEYKKVLKTIEQIQDFERDNPQKYYVDNFVLGEKKATKFTGYKIPDWNKISNTIVYFSQNLNPLKTTLNKLLFYSDFLHYKRFGKSITGLNYKAIQYGNVPDKFDLIFRKAESENKISIEYLDFKNGKVGERFKANTDFDKGSFNDEEINTLSTVFDFFKNKKPQEVVDICHEETSWIENHVNRNILDYSDAFGLKAL